jgi:hypothetical protein
MERNCWTKRWACVVARSRSIFFIMPSTVRLMLVLKAAMSKL